MHTRGVHVGGITTRVRHVTHYKEAVSQKRNGPIRFIHKANPKKKKFPIIILELKKVCHTRWQGISRTVHSLKIPGPSLLIDSEPERPVPRETLAPCDKLGAASQWGVSVGTHVCLRTCISSLTFHLALVSLTEALWAGRQCWGDGGGGMMRKGVGSWGPCASNDFFFRGALVASKCIFSSWQRCS